MDELQTILRHPTLAEILTVHHCEQTVKMLWMSVEIVEVENLVERSTVPLDNHISDILLVLTDSLWHTCLQSPCCEEILIVDTCHLCWIAVEHRVDNSRDN